MESYLRMNIPIEVIVYTDKGGMMKPMRFQFTDADGSTKYIKIERIISADQPTNRTGAFFECAAVVYGTERRFKLYYSAMSRRWSLQEIQG
ncbi:MAG: hypothetical protein J5626_08550 [Lachnospiraceae bacterium]|nr:hypothetical protein [Lachnospiraceae bacterium]